MIRTQQIYAEPNAPNTVIAKEELNENYLLSVKNKYLIDGPSDGNSLIVSPNALVTTDVDGNVKQQYNYTGTTTANCIIVTDKNCKLKWIGG